jgi:D-arabinose 1-dehydrogenase-like Zn-dependent alcohol dehydrogenase
MARMRAIKVEKPGSDFRLVQVEIPEPRKNEVLVKVEACGVCRGDAIVKEGIFPGLTYPRIPGHEVIGTVAALGSGVEGWSIGQRVGIGWRGGSCRKCPACRQGDFRACEQPLTTGISVDGGYADYMTARVEVLAPIPAELSSAEAAPLLCAGRTTFAALRSSNARAGDLVAIQGLGGLGHLAVQYAAKMGFRPVALSRGKEKEAAALKLGAVRYLDAETTEAATELKQMGGAKVIICTAPNARSIAGVLAGLSRNGQAVLTAASREPLQIPPGLLIGSGRSIVGSGAGEPGDAIGFSVQAKVLPIVECFPLEDAAKAYEKMMAAKVHFRSVLKM